MISDIILALGIIIPIVGILHLTSLPGVKLYRWILKHPKSILWSSNETYKDGAIKLLITDVSKGTGKVIGHLMLRPNGYVTAWDDVLGDIITTPILMPVLNWKVRKLLKSKVTNYSNTVPSVSSINDYLR